MEANTKIIELQVYSIIVNEKAVSTEDGNKVFEQIDRAFEQDNKVSVDFSGIVILISTFLNAAIGQLYSKYKSNYLNKNLSIKGLSNEDIILLRKVIDRAKEYFKDKNAFEGTVKESIDE